ncbi:hypothetical protein [Burkholderia anthina]|uniref:CDI system double-stranded DNA deaminase immunity protein DddI n=1 Tax=Burkholderia anthina TaxID=179879 RepID=UPI00158C511F|nr:hypothetical protein [Burkholderia anthina]
MYVDDFDGEIEVDSVEMLMAVVNRRPAFEANNFVLTNGVGEFPQLNIFARRDIVVVYYMDDGENFVSKGTDESGGTEKFYENKLGGEVILSTDCVVGKDEMLEASRQFFLTGKRPDCLS